MSTHKDIDARSIVGSTLGFLVSLLVFAVVIVLEYQYIQLPVQREYGPVELYSHSNQAWHKLLIWILLTAPASAGAAVAGWIAYGRPARIALLMTVVYVFFGPFTIIDADGNTVLERQMFPQLSGEEFVAASFSLFFLLSALFAIPCAFLASHVRKRRLSRTMT